MKRSKEAPTKSGPTGFVSSSVRLVLRSPLDRSRKRPNAPTLKGLSDEHQQRCLFSSRDEPDTARLSTCCTFPHLGKVSSFGRCNWCRDRRRHSQCRRDPRRARASPHRPGSRPGSPAGNVPCRSSCWSPNRSIEGPRRRSLAPRAFDGYSRACSTLGAGGTAIGTCTDCTFPRNHDVPSFLVRAHAVKELLGRLSARYQGTPAKLLNASARCSGRWRRDERRMQAAGGCGWSVGATKIAERTWLPWPRREQQASAMTLVERHRNILAVQLGKVAREVLEFRHQLG